MMKPLRLQENHLLVLNQRVLPREIAWIPVSTAEEMAASIRAMHLRGAPLLGIAAAYSLALEAKNSRISSPSSLLLQLENSAKTVRDARPTAVHLSVAVDRMLKKAREAVRENKPLGPFLLEEAVRIHEEDRESCRRIGDFGAEVLPAGAALTHCNTGALATGGEGTAYAILKEGYRRGKIPHVFACESRPYLQGARLTAFELREDRIPFTLLTDSMAGYFFSRQKISSVVVGADRIAANGDVANKIGTYGLAVLAEAHQIPFYVAASLDTIDRNAATGEKIPIEERDSQEVTSLMGVSIAPEGIHAAHPAFDITPSGLIRALITETGVASPVNRESLLALR